MYIIIGFVLMFSVVWYYIIQTFKPIQRVPRNEIINLYKKLYNENKDDKKLKLLEYDIVKYLKEGGDIDNYIEEVKTILDYSETLQDLINKEL